MRQLEKFPKGARVMMIGDSITCNGTFVAYIQDYYLSHFPEDGVLFFNAGVSGGTNISARRYLDNDLALYRPTHAVVMLGMNDVGRHLYMDEGHHTAEKAETDFAYMKGMIALCDKLSSLGLLLTLCTPTPFDDGMKTDVPIGKELGMALTGYGRFCMGLAEKYDASFVDYNTVMTAINKDLQKKDPTLSLIGAQDRVHPTLLGHAVMAGIFLHTQGFTDLPALTADAVGEWESFFAMSEKNKARFACEKITRSLRNTAYFTMGEDWQKPLPERMKQIEKYLEDEEKGVPHNPYITGLVKEYHVHAAEEEEYKARLLLLSEALYS